MGFLPEVHHSTCSWWKGLAKGQDLALQVSSKSCKCSYFSQCEPWVNKIHQAINILIHFSHPDRMNFSDVPLSIHSWIRLAYLCVNSIQSFMEGEWAFMQGLYPILSLYFSKCRNPKPTPSGKAPNQSQMMCYSQCIPSSVCGAANADKDIWGTQGSTRTWIQIGIFLM